MLHAPLFRREVIDARRDALLGAPLSLHSRLGWTLTWASIGFTALALATALATPYDRRAHASGQLVAVPGAVCVAAPQAGVLVRLQVAEGQAVLRGQVLGAVSGDRSTAGAAESIVAVQQQLRVRRDSVLGELAAQQDIERLALEAAQQRVRSLERQAAQAADEHTLLQRRIDSAAHNLERDRALQRAAFITEAALQQKEEAVLDLRAQLAAQARAQAAVEADLAAARSDAGLARLKSATGVAALRRQASEIEQQIAEAEQRRELLVTAPVDGVVTNVAVVLGQTLAAAQPLLAVVPQGAVLEAQLLLPTAAAAFVQQGQEVALRYAAFPYAKYGHAMGRVTQIGRLAMDGAESGRAGASGQAGYRVSVALPAQSVSDRGGVHALREGMALEADVVVGRRRLLDALLDPLRSLGARS